MKTNQAFSVIWDSIVLWWQDWANQIVVSLLAILAGLTVVLYPAAIFGIYQESLDLCRGTRTGIMGFWQGFKQNLKISLPWGLLNLLVIFVLGTNVWFYANTRHVIALSLVIFSIFILVFWLIWQFYSISCLFLQEEKSLKLAWKNGMAFILLQPGYAFIIALVMLLLLGLSVGFLLPFFLGTLPLMVLLGLSAVRASLPK